MGATLRICSSRHLEQEHSGIVSLVLGHLDIGDSLIGKARATLSIPAAGKLASRKLDSNPRNFNV